MRHVCDEFGNVLWTRNERHVAHLDLGGRGARLLCHEALECGFDYLVIQGHEISGGNRMSAFVEQLSKLPGLADAESQEEVHAVISLYESSCYLHD